MSYKTTMAACAKEYFYLDFAELYERHGLTPVGSPITSAVWTVTGANKGNEFINGSEVGVMLEPTGGPYSVVTAKATIEISNGFFKDCAELRIEVTP